LNYGQHEPVTNWLKCTSRKRNYNLYTSDQQLQGSSAQFTRQNANGDRHGFECPEERDYYPYWASTPWKDIAVITNHPEDCPNIIANSENVVGKGECQPQTTGKLCTGMQYASPNNQNDCIAAGCRWVSLPARNLPPPVCVGTNDLTKGNPPYVSRDNHLGNSVTLQMLNYNWTIPNDPHSACVLRLRYNISTADYPTNQTSSGNVSPSPKRDPEINLGYPWVLEMALNTNQYGRTFQDRSYVFQIRSRPPNIDANANIYNLNVRGKRGNIVQTYPAVEYDFTPNILAVKGGDYIHFQWTGSDYNPNRNPNDATGGPPDVADAGQTDPNNKNYRADRSNVVQSLHFDLNIPRPFSTVNMFVNSDGSQNVAAMQCLSQMVPPVPGGGGQPINDPNPQITCLNVSQLLIKNGGNRDNAKRDPQNCGKLNGAVTPYHDCGLVQMNINSPPGQPGFIIMSSRNNNFSNRSQKGIIAVTGAKFTAAASALSISLSMIFVAIVTVLALF
jgi:hypothetical protein